MLVCMPFTCIHIEAVQVELRNAVDRWASIGLCLHILHCLLTSCKYIRMHIRYLTRSTWKDRNGEARSASETMPCCPPPIRSRVSERSKSLRWWRASRFLSLLSCRLSSFCWAVNTLPYIWTRSGVIFYLPSPRPRSPSHDGILSGMCQKVRKLCINPYISIVNQLRTDKCTYIQAQT